jgi:hypothetical protein
LLHREDLRYHEARRHLFVGVFGGYDVDNEPRPSVDAYRKLARSPTISWGKRNSAEAREGSGAVEPTRSQNMHFLIGYTGSRYAGHAIGTAIKISDGYDPDRPKETVGSDWTLIFLDKNLGSEGRVLPILNEPPENGAKVVLAGYQKDHSLV